MLNRINKRCDVKDLHASGIQCRIITRDLFNFRGKNLLLEFAFGFPAITVISLHQNEQDHLPRVSADRMQRVDRSLSSARRNMFLSNHVLCAALRPLESATRRTGGFRTAEKQKEVQNSPECTGRERRKRDRQGERASELKFRIRSLNNRGKRDCSFYKEIGWPLCYWPGALPILLPIPSPISLPISPPAFLTRIIALRKRFDNFY